MTKGFWVFGYGSLMWEPGFDHAERALATLPGWRRSFCLHSIHYRGTEAAPGLVLGLDEAAGEACRGVAYRARDENAEAALAYLRARELISYAYRETTAEAVLADGRRVETLIYVIDHAHPQYAGVLPLEAQAEIIAAAHGSRGPNRDYLDATLAHLREIGVVDDEMERLSQLVAAR